MEFVFNTRAEAKAAPFFFTDQEIDNKGTAYGWKIFIRQEEKPTTAARKRWVVPESATAWDGYCAAIARRFARKNHPQLSYDDLFQEARLKVVELISEKKFPLANPFFEISSEYQQLSEEEIEQLSEEELRNHELLRDNIRFRTALKRALIDYSNRVR